jgi:hypothetical protein
LCRHCFCDKRHQFFFLAFKTFCKEIIHYLFIIIALGKNPRLQAKTLVSL